MEKSAADQLQILLKRNKQAEFYFQKAFRDVNDIGLKPFFKNSIQERTRFENEIKEMLSSIGEPSINEQNNFDHLNTVDKGASDFKILESCIKDEELILEDYHQAIANPNLTMEMREKLSEHFHYIKNSKEQIGKLEITSN